MQASASGTLSIQTVTGNASALYQVTYTWVGGGAVGSLTLTPEGDMSGSTNGVGTAVASGYVSTTYFGGLSNNQSAPPTYSVNAVGTATLATPASPVTYTIAGQAYATYSGVAGAISSTGVYFK